MENHDEPTPNDLCDEVFDHVHRYKPTLLTAEQSHKMLEDIRAAVLAAEPTSKISAGHMLTALCRFVVDVAPLVGCRLDEVLTDAQLARWTQDRELDRGPGRALATGVGILRRILRARKGMPAHIAEPSRRRLAAPPLTRSSFCELLESCTGDTAALRGFVASFGAGVAWGAAVGGRFVRDEAVLTLQLVDGTERRVIPEIAALGGVEGAAVLDGDWDALRQLAGERRIFIDMPIVL